MKFRGGVCRNGLGTQPSDELSGYTELTLLSRQTGFLQGRPEPSWEQMPIVPARDCAVLLTQV